MTTLVTETSTATTSVVAVLWAPSRSRLDTPDFENVVAKVLDDRNLKVMETLVDTGRVLALRTVVDLALCCAATSVVIVTFGNHMITAHAARKIRDVVRFRAGAGVEIVQLR